MISGYRAALVTPISRDMETAKRVAEAVASAVRGIKDVEVAVTIEYDDESVTSMPWPPKTK
jgi:hypothetical protein